ncbi:response regulator transcription factor [Anaerovoracaceae bacterium 41-7]|jgi:DNA-binding response OmpR family regulator|uniref:Stage 0 sporulation protein A homolog n=2 Tax=Oscillospiraceae TaxID=216572 RepID=A0A845QKX9_9FIRM|nr:MULTISPECIES: response regulator transcription factor [Clostridia]MCI9475373.1 response regulator transcription factor [Emergencia sp.]MCI9639410.1 response regulator transcription factor [Emergencia sp.]NBH60738.1 DNA-binding response regulator [Anaerotruncus colihominis]NCE99425.1 DNA-binding response regulator [Emergencia sp. 1XD21-10]NCF01392.1 DNA-binding response regulator [Anaerotruncus sp. 80]
MKLLIVEDEKRLCQTVAKHLKAEGYAVDFCHDGKDAFDYMAGTEYDAVILDIMLPGLDGISVLKTMRSQKVKTPVLLLTAKNTIEDKVKGLDSGADDYLTKPFSLEELSARIRVMIRRSGIERVDSQISAGPLTLDTDRKVALREGKEIPLTAKEYAILEYLMHNKGIVLSRDKMMNHIWNYDYEGSSNIIDVYIRTLRNKIDADFEVKLIQTVRGLGYVIKDET